MAEPKLQIEQRLDRLEQALLLLAERLSRPPLYSHGALDPLLRSADYVQIKETIAGTKATSGESTAPAGQPEDSLGRSGER